MRFACILLLFASSVLAQSSKPGEVDTLEVKRWGNRVTEIGSGIRAADDALLSMAMQVPVDDSDMWNITVWGSSRDQKTADLVKAFEKTDDLACFIAEPPSSTGQKQKPWAHFNVYYGDNQMQKFRFDRYKIPVTGPFPVITLNAPRNGHFGDYNIVVDRVEGMTDPKQLHKRITSSVDLWCKKLASEGFIPPKNAVEQFYGKTVLVDTTPKGGHEQRVGFPWGPNDPPKQPQINPQYPINGPAADPTVPATGGTILDWVDNHPGLIMVILVVLKVLEMMFPGPIAAMATYIEGLLKSKAKTPIIPDGWALTKDGQLVQISTSSKT